MNKISAKIWGSIAGITLGVLILWPNVGWRLIVILIITLIGYNIGGCVESGEEIKKKFRELFSLLFR